MDSYKADKESVAGFDSPWPISIDLICKKARFTLVLLSKQF